MPSSHWAKQKEDMMRHITSTITSEIALNYINVYSNQHRRTYVRVGERKHMELHEIAGTNLVLVLHTNVYSKTWSKNTAKIWVKNGDQFVSELSTVKAKRLLTK
jgi:hypothetical protein